MVLVWLGWSELGWVVGHDDSVYICIYSGLTYDKQSLTITVLASDANND